ncbi:MAG: hypothetical protein R3B74_04900 [Nitrospirales bacterium]|nr:hypothetical protein [Nitrospirales bacterium]
MKIQGLWYRSEVKLEGDMLVPVPPFHAYNPFDWYFPAKEIRQGEKSLYLEFIAVDSFNPEEVVQFCARFGMLGNSKALVVADHFKLDTDLRKLSKDSSSGARQRLSEIRIQKSGYPNVKDFGPSKLCQPMNIADFQRAQAEFVERLYVPEDPSPVKAIAEKEDRATFINGGIQASRVTSLIQWNVQTEQYESFYSSLDLLGLFYQMAQLDLLGEGKILACPRCGKPFVTGSDRVRFCSFPCYNVYKVQKHLREKKESDSKKRKIKAAGTQRRKS